jgi:hypothetical protein
VAGTALAALTGMKLFATTVLLAGLLGGVALAADEPLGTDALDPTVPAEETNANQGGSGTVGSSESHRHGDGSNPDAGGAEKGMPAPGTRPSIDPPDEPDAP